MDATQKEIMAKNLQANPLIAKRFAESASMADSILKELTDRGTNQLPERIFVSDFLPYFRGDKISDDKSDVVSIWIGIAGSPTSEVAIIDDAGRVMYNVPPLMDSSVISPIRKPEQRVGFSAIIALASQIGNNIPAMGETSLVRNLSIKSKEVVVSDKPTVHSQYEKDWLNIFNRYNVDASGVGVNKAKTETKMSDDEMGF